MMKPNYCLLLLAAALAFQAAPLHAQSYTAIDLGTLGGASSRANGINASGQIVGSAYTSGNSAEHATLFSGTGSGNTDLGTLGGTYSAAHGINASGQIMGYAVTSDDVSHATLFSGTGSGNIDLGTLGGTYNDAYGINASGQIVGRSTTSGDSAYHATLFSGTGSGNTDLGTLGGTNSHAYGINASGQIVGLAYTSGNTAYHATLFSGTGSGNTDLGTLGGTNSRAYGINASGQIVGLAYTSGNTAYHATLFSGTGSGNTDLGTLGGTNSRAYGINASGQIVGSANTSGNSAENGFLYVNKTMLDLNAITTGATNITIGSVSSPINDWGQIAAYGTVGGQTRALLLNPADPNTSTAAGVTNTKFVAGMNYDKFTALTRSSGLGTTVDLLDGTAGSGGNGYYGQNRDVDVFFTDLEIGLASDIVSLSGTSGIGFSDILVLQLTYDEATATALFGNEAATRLGWFDPGTGSWTLAVDGNTGGTAFFAGDRAYNAATDFHLGTYGLDTANNTVWAVTNHNSEFAAIPEPSTYALLALAGAAALLIKGRKTTRTNHKRLSSLSR
ncbi:PEP-CTERM protein-sorting domain-containing protein [Terrimicrobium sacchariphilum]|uniref:PEP-CTERM protein-sorting domain-containing protein n=1 Tax=Terrimicrobium sacchariphilum TaxID=690879 RepID=A0A146G3Q1_TERSA|nr:PEP-CTERM sorting domain-containing protein [Terrimicrobium sacchariphilum]GAT31488.1 PEP-CTERM protein-sorting domain-containing protein [Terrimicrobium sacchariphilum]